jgi:hypothetical protein
MTTTTTIIIIIIRQWALSTPGAIHFLTFGLKALTETNTSRLATGIYGDYKWHSPLIRHHLMHFL